MFSFYKTNDGLLPNTNNLLRPSFTKGSIKRPCPYSPKLNPNLTRQPWWERLCSQTFLVRSLSCAVQAFRFLHSHRWPIRGFPSYSPTVSHLRNRHRCWLWYQSHHLFPKPLYRLKGKIKGKGEYRYYRAKNPVQVSRERGQSWPSMTGRVLRYPGFKTLISLWPRKKFTLFADPKRAWGADSFEEIYKHSKYVLYPFAIYALVSFFKLC